MTLDDVAVPSVAWPRVPLGDLGKLYCGQSPPSSAVNSNGDGVPYVSGPEQWDGATLRLEKWTTLARRVVPAGCVFVTVKGAGVGTVFPGVPAAIGRDIYAFKPNEKVDARFVEHALRQTAAEVIRSARGDIPGLSKHHLLEHQIALPSLDDQKKTVAEIEKQFTRLDAGVAALRRVEANLRRYRAAVLKAACEGRLVPTEAELARREGRRYETGTELLERVLAERRAKWSGRGKYKEPVKPTASSLRALSDGWTWATVDQILRAELCNGVSVKGSDHPPGVRALRLSAMSDSGFNYADVRYLPLENRDVDDLFIVAGDFFVSRGNGSLRLVGRGTSAQSAPEPTIFPDTMIRLRLVPTVQQARWLSTIWASSMVREQIEGKVKTTAGIYKISQPQLARIVIPLPPLDEQVRIVADVELRLSVIEELEAVVSTNLQRATRLRQSVLQRAFEGRLA